MHNVFQLKILLQLLKDLRYDIRYSYKYNLIFEKVHIFENVQGHVSKHNSILVMYMSFSCKHIRKGKCAISLLILKVVSHTFIHKGGAKGKFTLGNYLRVSYIADADGPPDMNCICFSMSRAALSSSAIIPASPFSFSAFWFSAAVSS